MSEEDDNFYEQASALLNENSNHYTGVYKDSFNSSMANRRTFKAIEENRSVKPGFYRGDYEAFRPESALPKTKRESIRMCMLAYKEVGIIRNIIDLMGDFACQGIDLVHPNKSAETFYKQWFKEVKGKERSERFLNNLYRAGNVACYRSYSKVTPGMKKFMRAVGNDVKFEPPQGIDGQIPFRYNFFNPLSLDIKEDGYMYVNISNQVRVLSSNVSTFQTGINSNYVPPRVMENLPISLRNDIKQNKKQIKLDEDRLILAYYKKDDWEQWADPMINAILDDILMLQKMRLADLSALDGAISNIRLWTLGDLEHKIIPNKGAIDRLRDILATNNGGGTMELVWGPELTFKESATEVHKFLGSEKYDAVMNAIYAGLGVPPTLTGLSSNGGGFTNNFISLKTLVERLQYGRDMLIAFWEHEVELVRKTMGFRHPPKIVFDQMSLSDESSEKNLLIQLADRDIISHETLLERFKETPDVEKVRLQREESDRESNKMPGKASPFHNANHNKEMEKIEKQGQLQIERAKETINSRIGNGNTAGRPDGVKDTVPRKKRVDTPRSTPGVAQLFVWADDAWDKISASLSNAFLGIHDKSNLRQLTKEQTVELEYMKATVLASIDPMSDINDLEVYNALKSKNIDKRNFREMLDNKGISLPSMSVEVFRKSVLATYLELNA